MRAGVPPHSILLCVWTIFLLAALPASSRPSTLSSERLLGLRDPFYWIGSCRERAWNQIAQLVWKSRAFSDQDFHVNDLVCPLDHKPVRYEHDVVLRFGTTTQVEVIALLNASNALGLDVWESTKDWTDVRLALHELQNLLTSLPETLRPNFSPLLQGQDLVEAIRDTYPAHEAGHAPSQCEKRESRFKFSSEQKPRDLQKNAFFKDYQPLSVIVPWMRLLSSLFSSHVRLINIGISFEGRDIPALRVGIHPTNDGDESQRRKTILVSGGSHAREWISTTTVDYIAYSMITSYGKSAIVSDLLKEFDWVFIPTLNPDGYVYTWETDRLWRKNRQETPVKFCPGIDLDRTWEFMWDTSPSKNPCLDTYAGAAPFEGVESRRLAEWARNETENNNVEFIGFLDLHSYSQQILYPYSYTCYASPPTSEDLEELGHGLAKAIRLDQHKNYKVDSACRGNVDVDHRASSKVSSMEQRLGGGSALDWFYHEMRTRYAYQIKLRDTGSYGFLLPKKYIVPTGEEMLQATIYLGKTLLSGLIYETADASATGQTASSPLLTPSHTEVNSDPLEHSEELEVASDRELKR